MQVEDSRLLSGKREIVIPPRPFVASRQSGAAFPSPQSGRRFPSRNTEAMAWDTVTEQGNASYDRWGRLQGRPSVAREHDEDSRTWAPTPSGGPDDVVIQTLPHVNWNQFNGPNWTYVARDKEAHPGIEVHHTDRSARWVRKKGELIRPYDASRFFGGGIYPDTPHPQHPDNQPEPKAPKKREIEGQISAFD